jgi:CRP-like cAMP-binding protein
MNAAQDLRRLADERLFSGDLRGALHAYAALVRVQPENLDARLRVGDALLALGEVQRAAVVYTSLARHAAHAGYPLRALVALKVLSALEPQLEHLIGGLAPLYAEGSTRLQGRAVRISPGDPTAPLPPGFALGARPEDAVLFEVGCQVAADTTPIAQYPEMLPPIPLLSDLPAGDFQAVLSALKLVRTRPGDAVLREGEPGTSFFVLARGSVDVSRAGPDGPVALARLADGAIFGEMALVSSLPRSASVTAITDCDLLEFDKGALIAASSQVQTIAAALDNFTRERLLANLFATAPLFKPLDRKQRLDLIRRFSAHDLAPGTTVIAEGEAGRGLYVVLNGEVDVSKVDGADKVLLATLRAGDVFGEISLLHEGPTTATVTTGTHTTVLFLGRDIFQRLIEAVPEIRDYIENLGEERLMDTRILLSQSGEDSPAPDFVRV